MFDKVLSLITTPKKRDVATMVAGMASLMVGNKLGGLGLFARGALGLEQHWRDAHPDYHGGVVERWHRAIQFYESTHRHDTNRTLHIVGIPMIVGGAVGLLIFVPFGPRWWLSWSSFAGGWVLNVVGHGVFEKNAPAFADDPLSFLAGPVWDVQQLLKKAKKRKHGSGADVDTADVNPAVINVINVDPAEPARA
jgi:hypothetical protein